MFVAIIFTENNEFENHKQPWSLNSEVEKLNNMNIKIK